MDSFNAEDPFDPTAAVGWQPEGKPRVRPGVVLEVQVGATGVQTVTMEAQVDQNGNLPLQYLLSEPVQCDELTIDALQQKLVKAYQRYIKQPQVTVRFGAIDQRNGVSPYGTVTVMGEVASPGHVNMPATMDLTVTRAIQAAGGLKPFANKRRVSVTRHDDEGNEIKKNVDLVEIGEKGRIDKDLLLKPGDVVYVRETLY